MSPYYATRRMAKDEALPDELDTPKHAWKFPSQYLFFLLIMRVISLSAMQHQAPITALPFEIQLQIFQKLHYPLLLTCRQVCKSFNQGIELRQIIFLNHEYIDDCQ